jgi:hypothetical protein
MTNGQIAALVLGSAVVASLISAVIAAIAGYFTKRLEIRAAETHRASQVQEERLRLAVEMAKLNFETSKLIATESADSRLLVLKDPAEMVCLYHEALSAVAEKGASWNQVFEAMQARIGGSALGARRTK